MKPLIKGLIEVVSILFITPWLVAVVYQSVDPGPILEIVFWVLTVHVKLDRRGRRNGEVVVGGLARQDGVKVLPAKLDQLQLVDHLRLQLVDLLRHVVQQGVVSPPADTRTRATCKRFTQLNLWYHKVTKTRSSGAVVVV